MSEFEEERVRADSLTTRRDYLRIVTTVSGGLAIGSTVIAAGVLPRHGDGGAPPMLVAEKLSRGQAVAFEYPTDRDRAMGVRLADGTLVGYSTVCTHLACGVLWQPDRGDEGELYCPCHDGVFDVRTGDVKSGPPPRALPKVVLVEDTQGRVWAIGTARSGESEEQGLCRQLRQSDPVAAEQAGCDGPSSDPNGGAGGPSSAPSSDPNEDPDQDPNQGPGQDPGQDPGQTGTNSLTGVRT
ncbi:Rieske (2Fe-2S) protein [Kitasatospora viridis]|uniref:Cytochrome bc1 complex Rieske iron-sulfur subunit n=1 Tax=Kitasatospora viridis TaxID=281105 RepID=A0A561UKG9_9ACTN|nr:Rieske (2Fe-2S) protein [Kitasatospora viridis]TWF99859.1 Rieske Fe-S protein [Kitasatospora viridis]